MSSEGNIPQLVKKLPELYETRNFITAFTARHMFLSWVSSVQSTISCSFLMIHFNIILPFMSVSSKWSLSVRISVPATCATCLTPFILLYLITRHHGNVLFNCNLYFRYRPSFNMHIKRHVCTYCKKKIIYSKAIDNFASHFNCLRNLQYNTWQIYFVLKVDLNSKLSNCPTNQLTYNSENLNETKSFTN
jgi:hypothetical protein